MNLYQYILDASRIYLLIQWFVIQVSIDIFACYCQVECISILHKKAALEKTVFRLTLWQYRIQNTQLINSGFSTALNYLSHYGNEGNVKYNMTCIDFIWQADTSRSKSRGSLIKPVEYRNSAVPFLLHTGTKRKSWFVVVDFPQRAMMGKCVLKCSHLMKAPSSCLFLYQQICTFSSINPFQSRL